MKKAGRADVRAVNRHSYRKPLDRIELPAGTMVHIHGLPFRLEAPTMVLGRKENYDLAVFWEEELREERAR